MNHKRDRMRVVDQEEEKVSFDVDFNTSHVRGVQKIEGWSETSRKTPENDRLSHRRRLIIIIH